MHVLLPKVVNGQFVMTAILATSIHGMEPRDILVNGKTVKGTKVYGPFGAFKVLCTPTALARVQTQVITSGKAASVSEPPATLQIASAKSYVPKTSYNKLSSGKKWKA